MTEQHDATLTLPLAQAWAVKSRAQAAAASAWMVPELA